MTIGVRKDEPLIRVTDPKGEVHEMPSRNGYDMINHFGWKLEETEEEIINEAAHAPRAIKKVAEQLEEKLRPKGVDTAAPVAKVPNKAGKTGALRLPKEPDVNKEYAKMDARQDLDALEKEEEKRGTRGSPSE